MLTRSMLSRELLRECRHRIHFVGRALFVLALGGLIAWRWRETPHSFDLALVSRAEQAQTLVADFGRELFSVWALVQYGAVCLFTTVRAAGLGEERRIGCLPLLRITPQGERGIVVGSFLSVMGRAAFTVALALPVLVMSRAFGGFTLGQAGAVIVVTLAGAAQTAALTLAIAAISQSTAFAVVVSIVLQAVWHIVPFAAFGQVPSGARWLTAVGALLHAVEGARPSLVRLAVFIGMRAVLVLAFLSLAARLLRRALPRPAQPIKRALTAADGFFLRLARNRHLLWKGGRAPCRGNPILWRERAASLIARRDHKIRLAYLTAAAAILVAAVVWPVAGYAVAVAALGIALVAVPLAVFTVSVVVTSAAAFARERQRGTLDLVAVTPLTSRQIVLGKYAFALRFMWLPFLVAGVYLGLQFYLYKEWDIGDLEASLPLALLAPLVVAQTLYVGLGARTQVTAIVVGFVLLGSGVVLFLPEIKEDILYPITVHYPVPLPGLGLLAPIAVALTAVALAPRFRLLRNPLFLVLAVPGVIFAVEAAGLTREGPDRPPWSSDNPLAWGGYVLAGALGCAGLWLGAHARSVRRAPETALSLVVLIVLTAVFLVYASLPQAWFLLGLAFLGALFQAARFAGPGVVGRALVALIAPWALMATWSFLYLNFGLHGWSWASGPWRYGYSVYVELCFLSITVIATTAVFLLLAVRQAGRFMERNG